MDKPREEPCKFRAEDVQDCLEENKFSLAKCDDLIKKLEKCCWRNNWLKSLKLRSSTTVVAYTFEPAFNGEKPKMFPRKDERFMP